VMQLSVITSDIEKLCLLVAATGVGAVAATVCQV